MSSTTYTDFRQAALDALRRHRLLDALNAIQGQMAHASQPARRQELDELRQAYALLLDYFKRGTPDPTRDEQFLHLLGQAHDLSERIHHDHLAQHSPLHRFETLRSLQALPDGATLDAALARPPSADRLFELVWTSGPWQSFHLDAALALTCRTDVGHVEKGALVSAVALALLSSLDARKMEFLLRLLDASPAPALYNRAHVGAVFALLRHDNLLALHPHLLALLRRLHADARFGRQLVELQQVLLIVQDAPTHLRRMAQDLLPTLLEAAPHLINNDEATDTLVPTLLDDLPAETRDTLAAHLNHFVETFHFGLDIGYVIFRRLAARFPFFKTAAHWFIPFTWDHPDIAPLQLDPTRWEAFFQPRSSDSDRYAHAFFFHHLQDLPDTDLLPADPNTISTPFGLQIVDPGLQADPDRAALHGIVHDLYRFFRLFPQRDETDNPFRLDLRLYNSPHLLPPLDQPERREALAKFAFRFDLHNHALDLLADLPDTPDRLRMRAEAHHTLEEFDKAAECYERLLLLDQPDPDIVHALADCLLFLHRPDDALVHLLRFEPDRPDDPSLLLRIAASFIGVELYDDALQYLHKILYLDPHNREARQNRAALLTHLRRFPEARRDYDTLLASSPTPDDLAHAAHAAWADADPASAAVLYAESLRMNHLDAAPPTFFDEARAELLHLGISERDLQLMTDLINSDLAR